MWWPFKKRQTKAQSQLQALRPGRVLTSLGGALTFSNDQSFKAETRSVEERIKATLTLDRGRMRTLEDSNDYAIHWLQEVQENVVGGNGFRFQSKVLRANGNYNKPINDALEAAWKEQAKPENYTIEGESSAMDETAVDKLILRSVIRDGFVFIVVHENWDNETGFAIQLMSGDTLDHELCMPNWRGARISNGVEIRDGKVTGYHLSSRNGEGSVDSRHKRLDAANIIFPFVRTDPAQYVGQPWAKAVMNTLHGLDQYEEAVITAAREGAVKAMFYEQDLNSPTLGVLTADDLSGEIEPGSANLMPAGVKAVPYDPSQPTDTYGDFREGVLLRAASGLNISYQSLSGDLSKGTFASQRVGLLDEREIWKGLQTWFCTAVKCRIYKRWLAVQRLRMGELPGMLTLAQMNKPEFIGKRWDWVDPEKDAKAAVLKINNGLTSRSRVIADSDTGTDHEGTMREIQRETELEESLGLDFSEQKPASMPAQQSQPPEENEQEEQKLKVV